MTLIALPAFADYSIWKRHDGPQAVVVDPGDAAPETVNPNARHPTLAAILVTHHHADHVGGIDATPTPVFAALRPWKNELQ